MAEHEVDATKHILVPKHEKLNEEQANALLEKLGLTINQLPKILKSDAAIRNLNPEVHEIIKITRKSATVGEAEYYRAVVNG